LIYMGDEIALTNDATYLDNPNLAHDSRWTHRPFMDWDRVAEVQANPNTPQARVYDGVRHIFARRKATHQIHGGNACRVRDTGNPAVFAFSRIAPSGILLCLFNFTENWQHLPGQWLRDQGVAEFWDALGDASLEMNDDILTLPPYGRVWLT